VAGDSNVRIWFQTAAGETAAVRASADETLLETARNAGIAIDAPCSGSGTCGKCKIRLTAGDLITESSAGHNLTDEEYQDGYRLACQCRPAPGISDIEIFVPATSIAFSSRIRVEGFEEIRT
jgi:ferredoxin